MKLSKELRIGIVVTTGIALLFWGLNYLKGIDFFTRSKMVYAIYDRVDGLAASNPVHVNGMKVGLIHSLELLPDHSGKILVSMHVNNKVRIPRNSIAEIYSTDLLGAKGVRFVFGNSPDDIHDGDTLQAIIQRSLSEEVNAEVAPFKEKAENLISSVDSVLQIVRSVFNEATKKNLRNAFESISNSLMSIQHVTSSMDTVLAKQGRLSKIFNNLESITENLKQSNGKIARVIDNFASITDTLVKANLAVTLDHASKTLEQTAILFEKINKGEGTLGQLSSNDSLYNNLNSTARDLDSLMIDLRENPKRYIHFSVISFGGGKKKNKATH